MNDREYGVLFYIRILLSVQYINPSQGKRWMTNSELLSKENSEIKSTTSFRNTTNLKGNSQKGKVNLWKLQHLHNRA